MQTVVEFAQSLMRWLEAVTISVVLGVAAVKTESWIIDTLFWLSLVPPFVFTIAALAAALKGGAKALELQDDVKVSGNTATVLHLVASVLGAIILLIILFVISGLIAAELPGA